MKVIVPIKRVIDANIRIRIKADETGVETENVKTAINPFCEIAVEEAIRMKEAGAANEIIVVTVGPAGCQDILRTAMAMGADRAILMETDRSLQPMAVARLLKTVVDQEQPQLVILGKQAIDDDNNQTGQILAGKLGWPQGTFASRIKPAGKTVEVTREVDGGLETLSLKIPAVITTDLRLNEPRYVKLPDIMRAKKKPVQTINVADTGVNLDHNLRTIKVSEPPARQGGMILDSVSELVTVLKSEVDLV